MKRDVDREREPGNGPDGASAPLKSAEPDDPMRLRAELVEGNPQVMLEGLIEEYARMGWGAGQIGRIFEDPFFGATHALATRLGGEAIRDRIEQTLQRCGVFRFDTIEVRPAADLLPGADKAKHRPETLTGERDDA